MHPQESTGVCMTLRSEVGMQLSLLQRRQPKASQSEKTIRCIFCLNTQKPIVRARAAWLLAFPGAKVKLLKSKGRTGSSWARFGEPYAFEKRVQLLNWGSGSFEVHVEAGQRERRLVMQWEPCMGTSMAEPIWRAGLADHGPLRPLLVGNTTSL